MRLPLLLKLIDDTQADVICLQETKTPDEHFPYEALIQAGYPHIIYRGEKSYNGVAILSKHSLSNTQRYLHGGNEQTRHLSATLANGIDIHNVYIPAGGDDPDALKNPKFAHKLQFVEDLTYWSKKQDSHRKQIIVGDFNIAPLEHDVWSSKQLRLVVSHTDIEREKLIDFQQAGQWIDSHRHFTPDNEKLYSWWSYRARDWQASNKGRRLDHIWVSPKLKNALAKTTVLIDYRGAEKPSDHAPIMTTLQTLQTI